MKLLYLSIIYSLLLINIPTYSMNEKESKESIKNLHKVHSLDEWSPQIVSTLIYKKSSNKTPSELADYFKISNAPIKRIERENPKDWYEQNYQTARYIFLNSNYAFNEFLDILKKACST